MKTDDLTIVAYAFAAFCFILVSVVANVLVAIIGAVAIGLSVWFVHWEKNRPHTYLNGIKHFHNSAAYVNVETTKHNSLVVETILGKVIRSGGQWYFVQEAEGKTIFTPIVNGAVELGEYITEEPFSL